MCYGDQTMYTIKQASARTGLTIPTIRVWERRYGVVRPGRTPAGYRLYDEAAIDRLVAMRHLVEREGWRPSQAAERVITAGDDVASLLPDPSSTSGPAGSAIAAPTDDAVGLSPDAAVETYLAAARSYDVPAMERVLDDAFASRRYERAMDEIVFPVLRAIGAAWERGDLDVAQEHVSSETIRRRLARFYDIAGSGGWTTPVVVGMPPGGQHELGALAFAVAGRRAGLDILYLGPNVPLDSWLRTVREVGARVAVLAVVTRGDVAGANAVIAGLRAVPHAPSCLVGGSAAGEVPDGAGVIRLPDGTDEAIALTIALLADDGRPS